MYDIREEDIDHAGDRPQLSSAAQSAPLQMQLPVVELLKVCILIFFIFSIQRLKRALWYPCSCFN